MTLRQKKRATVAGRTIEIGVKGTERTEKLTDIDRARLGMFLSLPPATLSCFFRKIWSCFLDITANIPSPRESRFGRLRGRSASPASDEDGRLGFAEDGSMNTTRRYRGRSRGDDRRRQRSRSRGERDFGKRGASSALETNRWEKDRSAFTDSGPWPKNASNGRLDVRSHRRSDATDETNNKGSLLSRMTKDGKPLLATKPSLASRITRGDTESPASYGRLRADTEPSYGRLRSTDESYGRLKDDDSAPREDSFQEPGVKSRDLASRITWKRDRGATNHENGFNIKGSAPQVGGFSIKGAAGGDFN